MKTILFGGKPFTLLVITFALLQYPVAAQTDQWTWVSGDNTPSHAGIYGTKGVAAPSNQPGSRTDAATWTDNNNNLWLFGGLGYDANGTLNELNDLWKYDPVTNQWTWINGSNAVNQTGMYGSKGVPSSANQPGGRHYFITWKDLAGNLWLFGGNGYAASGSVSFLNDLWKYDPVANQWTWVNGDNSLDQLAVYGVKGVAASTNKPGARRAATGMVDAAGNLWLFGGDGFTATPLAEAYLNDLWKYDPTANQWTWISGDNTIDPPGVYGSLGVSAAANKPGARWAAVSWSDRNHDFWVFGGKSRTASGSPDLNDLWEYDFTTGRWTWFNGDSTANVSGVYGTLGVPAPANKPGGRYEMISWTDTNHDCWLLGGDGFDAYGGNGNLNDVWKYNIASNTWTWMNGANFTGYPAIYGTKGVPAAGNQPGARARFATWLTNDNTLWVFGGAGAGFLNDLWVYKPNIILLATGFLHFTATTNRKQALLNWQVTGENNTGCFNIQHSIDGWQWQSIATVAASGKSTGVHNYQYTDASPAPGINYYRLQQHDNNGQLLYSPAAELFFSTSSRLVCLPAGAQAIKIYLQNGGSEKYILTAMDGRRTKQGTLQNGGILLTQLSPGAYVLQVMGAAGIITQKIMVP